MTHSNQEDKESFTFKHSDIKDTLNQVIEAVQAVRDTGAALFDRALDWYSEEDQVKILDTVTANTKMLSKIDGLCNYISLHIDNDALWAFPSKMEKFESMTTDEIIKSYKDVTDQLRKDVMRLEGVTSVLHPSIESEKPLYAFVVSDVKDCSNLVYTSLNEIERANDMNAVRTALSRGEDVQPRNIGAIIPRK